MHTSTSKATLLILAALAAGASHAQSTVTIYGLLDGSAARVSAGSAKLSKVDSSVGASSRLGFSATEDLGGGLSAFFNLEMGLALDTGGAGSAGALSGTSAPAAAFFNRNSYVGLRGPLGALTLGRNYTAGIVETFNANVLPTGVNTGLATAQSSQGLANDFWNNNQVRYDSPTFGGLSFKVAYALGEAPGSLRSGASKGASVTYRNPDLVVSLSAQQDNDATGKDVSWQFLSASYKLGAFKLGFGWDRVDNSPAVVSSTNSLWRDSRLVTLGLSYQASSQLTLAAQHYKVHYTATNSNSSQTVLTGVYNLSKRTSVYGLYSRTDSGPVAIASLFGTAGVANVKGQALALGVQHRF